MKLINKILSVMIALTLMVTPVTISAATPSPQLKVIASSNATVTAPSLTYNGKTQTAKITCNVVVDGKTLVQGTDYVITTSGVKAAKNAGTYTVKVTITGKGHFTGSVTKTVTYKVNPKAQKITVPKKKTVSKATLNKKGKVTFKIKVKKRKGRKLVFKSKAKYVKVSKKGKVTISKKAKKGTYYIRVYAKKGKNYKKSYKKIKVVVK